MRGWIETGERGEGAKKRAGAIGALSGSWTWATHWRHGHAAGVGIGWVWAWHWIGRTRWQGWALGWHGHCVGWTLGRHRHWVVWALGGQDQVAGVGTGWAWSLGGHELWRGRALGGHVSGRLPMAVSYTFFESSGLSGCTPAFLSTAPPPAMSILFLSCPCPQLLPGRSPGCPGRLRRPCWGGTVWGRRHGRSSQTSAGW